MATESKTKDMSTSIMHGKTLICGWSVIDRGWVGLKNNGFFPLSLAIWVRASPQSVTKVFCQCSLNIVMDPGKSKSFQRPFSLH